MLLLDAQLVKLIASDMLTNAEFATDQVLLKDSVIASVMLKIVLDNVVLNHQLVKMNVVSVTVLVFVGI